MHPISTDNAPAAIGPYSQAVRAGDWLYCSGQIPLDPSTGALVGGDDTAAQTRQVLKNLSAVIEAAGGTLEKVVKCGVFLQSMDDFGAMNAVYSEFFSSWKPARAAVEVARLPKDVRVEIEAVVYLGA